MIINFQVDSTSNRGANIIGYDYSGNDNFEYLYIEVSYDGGSFWQDLSPQIVNIAASNNTYEDANPPLICGSTVFYRIRYKIASDPDLIYTEEIAVTNACLPNDPPINFSMDCVNKRKNGIDLDWADYTGNAYLKPYIVQRIYRSTLNPSTITLPNAAYSLIGQISTSFSSYDDTTANAGTQYWYQLSYYNSITGEESIKRTVGPCTTLINSCADNLPVSIYDFTYEVDCNKLLLTGLINDAANYVIPSGLTCSDITQITAMRLRIFDSCNGSATDSEYIDLFTGSANYNIFTQNFEFTQQDGIWGLELTVEYLDTAGTAKTVITTKCAAVVCELKCSVSEAIAKDLCNNYLIPIYESISYLAKCGYCDLACVAYEFLLNKLDNECDC